MRQRERRTRRVEWQEIRGRRGMAASAMNDEEGERRCGARGRSSDVDRQEIRTVRGIAAFRSRVESIRAARRISGSHRDWQRIRSARGISAARSSALISRLTSDPRCG